MKKSKTYKLIVSKSTEIKDSIDADTKYLIISGVCVSEMLEEYFSCNEELNITTLDLSELKVIDGEFYFISWFNNLKTIIFPKEQEIIKTDFCCPIKKYIFPTNLKKLELYINGNCKIKELSFPDTLKSLSLNLCSEKIKLESIHLGKNISEIECLDVVPHVKTIEIDSENKYFVIYNNALYTKDLTKLIKYLSVEEIDEYIVKEGTLEICKNAFEDAKFKKIILPESLIKIGNSAFYYCKMLDSVEVPDSVQIIEDYAFAHCENLKYLKLSNSVEKLEDYVLEECFNLEKLHLPDNLRVIGSLFFMFTNCLSSVDMVFQNKSSHFKMLDGIIYSNDLKNLVSVIDKNKNSYDIPNGVQTIEYYAFSGCSNVKFLRLPDSVTTIKSHSFSYCSNLKKIVIGKNLKEFADSAIAGCENLKYLVINTLKPPKHLYNSDLDDFDYISFKTVNLVIPCEVQIQYEKTDFWSRFKYIYKVSKPCCKKNNNNMTEEDVKKFIQEATDGDMCFQFSLSVMYEYGWGVKKDMEKSLYWLKKSAAQGELNAMYKLSHYYEEIGDYDSKIKLLKQIRKTKVDPTSDFWLDKENFDIYLKATNDYGLSFYNGSGVRKNYKKAFDLYCQSAKYGVPESISNKGVCYEWGLGTRKNQSKAFCCYRHAAQKGLSVAMVKLANCYSSGIGVEKNKEKYMFWMQKALNLNDCSAQNDIAFEYLTGKFLEKDFSKAKSYFMMSVNNPNGGEKNKLDTIASARKGNKLDIKMLTLCAIEY
jgi:TPR repeat protein